MAGVFAGTAGLLGKIRHSSIDHNPECSVDQKNSHYLTSYNLMSMDRSAPSILVPGSPAVWFPKSVPILLSPDKGRFFIDPIKNAFPTCPLEPLFRALDHSCPALRMDEFDLITDRRNLRQLLAFVAGATKELRIDTEIVGKTVLFYCWTGKKNSRFSNGTHSAGYGTTFEKRFTEYPRKLSKTITHNRIIKYTLGGIRFLVRFEVDGCLRPLTRINATAHQTYVAPTGTRVTLAGSLTPSRSIIELKSGPVRNMNQMKSGSNLAQLWFSMTPILICGVYEGQGEFTTLEQINVTEDGSLDKWAVENKENLQKLVKLIEMIIERLTTSSTTKQALIVTKSSSELEFHNISRQTSLALPPDIRARWMSKPVEKLSSSSA